MTGVLFLIIAVLALIGIAAWIVAFFRREDARDDRLARRDPFPPQPRHTGFADIQRPPGIASDVKLSAFPPRSSPAGLPPPSPAPGPQGGGGQPGAAAAAADSFLSPPPLPDPDYATANPSHPYHWWDPTREGSDQFVEAMTAKDGA